MTEIEKKAKAYEQALGVFESVLDDLIHEGEMLEEDLADGFSGVGMTRKCFENRTKKKLMREVICYMNESLEEARADARDKAHGEWIPKESENYENFIDVVCSKCGYVGIEKYAYGFEADEVPLQDMREYTKEFDLNFCPCCGADMRGKADE